MSNNNLSWEKFNDRRRKIKYIGHQHLSNILWFNEIFYGMKPYTFTSNYALNSLQDELIKTHMGRTKRNVQII